MSHIFYTKIGPMQDLNLRAISARILVEHLAHWAKDYFDMTTIAFSIPCSVCDKTFYKKTFCSDIDYERSLPK